MGLVKTAEGVPRARLSPRVRVPISRLIGGDFEPL
jgi:hypothetical protein